MFIILISPALFSQGTNGRIIPSKHIVLGSALKSLTSSKKVVKILHRYGHICSYDVIQELETEATYTTMDESRLCPSEIQMEQGLCTGTAFDNFDRFVETTSGKTTMNDTVGIIFQEITDRQQCNKDDVDHPTAQSIDSATQDESPSTSAAIAGKKRRKSYKAIFPELQPYWKKPKIDSTMLPFDSPLRQIFPADLMKIKSVDIVWMISHVLGVRTPMWVGFNAQIIPDNR